MAKSGEIDWNDLRFLVEAAQARSFAATARALAVEHTTVGRRLTALERALGAPVFIRRADGLQLTSFGERLLPLVEEVQRSVRAVQ